jgi:hypothetical protein
MPHGHRRRMEAGEGLRELSLIGRSITMALIELIECMFH